MILYNSTSKKVGIVIFILLCLIGLIIWLVIKYGSSKTENITPSSAPSTKTSRPTTSTTNPSTTLDQESTTTPTSVSSPQTSSQLYNKPWEGTGSVVRNKKSVEEGKWGKWKVDDVNCEDDEYVCGIKVRFEKDQGSTIDDTALNGIEMRCCKSDGSSTTKIVEEGKWGDWKDEVKCSEGEYVCGMQTRFEDPQPGEGDDSALNGIKMRCCKHLSESSELKTVEEGIWGTWKDEVICDSGYYVCGMQTRFEDPQPGNGDDTALNGIRINCCIRQKTPKIPWEGYGNVTKNKKLVENGVWGKWKNEINCTDGEYVCGMKVRFEKDQGSTIDDTALNGIEMRCCKSDGSSTTKIVEEGKWGDWKDEVRCSDGEYVCGMQTRFEDPISGGDNSALNGIKMRCCKPLSESSELKIVEEGIWGTWKDEAVCAKGYYVCGMEIRFEDPLPENGDDSALNGISMNCCIRQE